MSQHPLMSPSRFAWTVVGMVALTSSNPAPAQDVREDYARADRLRDRTQGKVFRDRVTPHWYSNNDRLWYRVDLPGGAREFIGVDAVKGERKPAFDHAKVAASLSKAAEAAFAADRLPFDFIQVEDDGKVRFEANGQGWSYDPSGDSIAKAEAPRRPAEEAPPSEAGAAVASDRGKVPSEVTTRRTASTRSSSRTTTSTSATRSRRKSSSSATTGRRPTNTATGSSGRPTRRRSSPSGP